MNYSKSNNNKKRKGNKSNKKRVKNKAGVIILRVFLALLLIGGFAVGGAFVGAYLGIIKNAPELGEIILKGEGEFTSIIYLDSTQEEIDRLDGGENREYATSKEIPKKLKDAFIAIEDERFYNHDGVDVKGLFRAVYSTVFEGDRQGASTLTQQLIKNKQGYLNNTIDTKLQEQYLAIEYEKSLKDSLGSKEKAKDYILEQYLNIVTLGEGQIGVKAATQRYFNKELKDLTIAESASIAAITQRPIKYAPTRFPENNKERQTAVLKKMLELEMITQAEYDEAIDEDIYSKISAVNIEKMEETSVHSYYIDALIEQVIADLAEKKNLTLAEASNYLYTGGLSIYSAEDPDMQKILDEAFLDESLFPSAEFEIEATYLLSTKNTVTGEVTHHPRKTTIVKTVEEAKAFGEAQKDELMGMSDIIDGEALYAIPQPQAAMTIIDYRTGQVKAVSGGRGEKQTNRGLNRSTQALRQPGSAFKIIASFAPGIDMNLITPATVIDDSAVTYPDYDNYSPKNWYSGFRGPRTVRTAIRDSMNVITVKNMYNIGVQNAMKYVENFHFTTLEPSDYVLAACLGGINGVSQLELTAAYGTIANGGEYNKPIFYTKVFDNEGNLILDNTVNPEPVLKATSAYLLTDMMKDVVTGGTGGKANFKNIRMPIAGKTGTTTLNKDLTFVGYTPYYVAGIWFGYDQPKSMSGRTEGTHSTLWSHVMEKIHEGLEYKEFERPEGIISANICTISGNLSSSFCAGNTKDEIFAAGTQPTKYCDSHVVREYCTVSGKLASIYCPSETIELRSVSAGASEESEIVNEDGSVSIVPDVGNQICDIHNAGNTTNPNGTPQIFFDDDGNPITAPFDDGDLLFPDDYGESPLINERPPQIPDTQNNRPNDQQNNQQNVQPTAPPQTPNPTEPPIQEPIIDEGPMIP